LHLIVDEVYWVVIISKEDWASLLVLVVALVVYRVVNMLVVVLFLLLVVYRAVNMLVVILFLLLIWELVLFVVKVFVLVVCVVFKKILE
jgi:hypothetical protein